MRIGTLAVAALLLPAAAWADVTGKPGVLDADTVVFGGERRETFRLGGIDAPETRQLCEKADGSLWPCGKLATAALKAHIGDAPVTCRGEERDRYGRRVGVCYLGDENLNQWLVREGWAIDSRVYLPDYRKAEAVAICKEAGIWQGRFVWPYRWRRGKRLARTSVPGEHPKEGATKAPPAKTTKTAPNDVLDRYDANRNGRITCAEVRKAGGPIPVTREHPAYQYMRDHDRDGVVCEGRR